MTQRIFTSEITSVDVAISNIDNRKYAIKKYNKDKLNHTTAHAMINEIKIHRKLDHQKIVKIYRIYEDESFISLVLEYAERDLLYYIKKKRKFTEETVKKFARQMLDVLRYLNRNNVIHRDIKPENILVFSEDRLDFKICDFGIACESSQNETLICGSPGYIAPEILRKSRYDAKVDIFSLGIVLYSMLTGNHPLIEATVSETLKANKRCNIVFLHQH